MKKRQRKSNKSAKERIYIDEVTRAAVSISSFARKKYVPLCETGSSFLHHRTSPRKGGLERVLTNKHFQWR
jgi:hypothetical protein